MDDKTLKHLEFIQNTINRMSTNSFIIKGWAITLVGIILGLNKLEGNYIFKKSFYNFPIEMVILILIIFLFWFINAYFLQQERRYIYIYSKTIEPFNVNPQGSNNLLLDMNYKNYDTSSSNSSMAYYCISIVSVLCVFISCFFFDQVVFKIIFTVVFVLISLFTITYILPNQYLCNYWACFMGRTIISVYGTMIVLLLLANHSMFNIESKIKNAKTECECIIKNNSK